MSLSRTIRRHVAAAARAVDGRRAHRARRQCRQPPWPSGFRFRRAPPASCWSGAPGRPAPSSPRRASPIRATGTIWSGASRRLLEGVSSPASAVIPGRPEAEPGIHTRYIAERSRDTARYFRRCRVYGFRAPLRGPGMTAGMTALCAPHVMAGLVPAIPILCKRRTFRDRDHRHKAGDDVQVNYIGSHAKAERRSWIRSSASSMPTDRRTSPSSMPSSARTSAGTEAWVMMRRMLDQALDAAETFGEREQLAALQEARRALEPALDAGGDDAAEAAHLALGEFMLRMRGEARIDHAVHARMGFEELRDLRAPRCSAAPCAATGS